MKELDKPLRLALEPALTVRGQITDPNGTGVKAARVSLCVIYANCLSKIGAEVLTDSKGHFEFNAIAPKHETFDYRISVHAAGFGPKTYDRISIEGRPGTTDHVETVQLMPADSSISGIVVDANGLPAARVPIFLRGSGGADQPRKTTATNEKGQFAFTRICNAPLRFQANFPTDPEGMGNLDANGGDKDVKIVLGQKGIHTPFVSLTGKPLPDLSSFNVKLSQTDLTDKRILVCFFDMEQRPSRNCLRQLKARVQQLKAEDVVVVAVQASKIDKDKLDSWAKENINPFSVGMIEGDAEKTRLSWGIRSLPWLILTDNRNVVTAAGFGLSELEEKIRAAK